MQEIVTLIAIGLIAMPVLAVFSELFNNDKGKKK